MTKAKTAKDVDAVLTKAMEEHPPIRKRPSALDAPEIREVCEAYLEGRAAGRYGSVPWFNRHVLCEKFQVELTNNAVQKTLINRFPDLWDRAVHGKGR